MYVRDVKSVIRCYKRTYAIFVAQIGGVLELERHECGALWSADIFPIEIGDATESIGSMPQKRRVRSALAQEPG